MTDLPHSRIDRRSGNLQYRRSVPPQLRSAFGRKWFERSCGGKKDDPAARAKYAELHKEFEERIASLTLGVPHPAALPSPPVAVEPQAALVALERWAAEEIKTTARKVFNGELTISLIGKDRHALSDLIYRLSRQDGWKGVPDFDETLVEAITSQNITLSANAPTVDFLRKPFAEAWLRVLRAKDKMTTPRGGFDFSSATDA